MLNFEHTSGPWRHRSHQPAVEHARLDKTPPPLQAPYSAIYTGKKTRDEVIYHKHCSGEYVLGEERVDSVSLVDD